MPASCVRYIVLRTESSEPSKDDTTSARALLTALEETVVGQREALRALVLGAITGGHVLLEGAPGLAKTFACRALASACDGSFARIQFMPDLLPSDIIGTRIFDQRTAEFRTRLGPIFANIVLADEINRAPAKVQAALLEAMQERCVSIAFERHVLPDPFLVLATMNAADSDGTYGLSLAQLDRFLLNVRLNYPSQDEEREILRRCSLGDPPLPSAIMPLDSLRRWRGAAAQTTLSDTLYGTIVRIVRATRPRAALPTSLHAYVDAGAGPRASIAIAKLARAHAFLDGRTQVDISDIERVAPSALRHRLGYNFRVQTENLDIDAIIHTIVASVCQ